MTLHWYFLPITQESSSSLEHQLFRFVCTATLLASFYSDSQTWTLESFFYTLVQLRLLLTCTALYMFTVFTIKSHLFRSHKTHYLLEVAWTNYGGMLDRKYHHSSVPFYPSHHLSHPVTIPSQPRHPRYYYPSHILCCDRSVSIYLREGGDRRDGTDCLMNYQNPWLWVSLQPTFKS